MKLNLTHGCSKLHEFVQTYLAQPVKLAPPPTDEVKQVEMRRRLLARLVMTKFIPRMLSWAINSRLFDMTQNPGIGGARSLELLDHAIENVFLY